MKNIQPEILYRWNCISSRFIAATIVAAKKNELITNCIISRLMFVEMKTNIGSSGQVIFLKSHLLGRLLGIRRSLCFYRCMLRNSIKSDPSPRTNGDEYQKKRNKTFIHLKTPSENDYLVRNHFSLCRYFRKTSWNSDRRDLTSEIKFRTWQALSFLAASTSCFLHVPCNCRWFVP